MEIQEIYRPYTPSRQNADVLERTTTGRENILQNLLGSIRDQIQKPTHQHWLLIGPRGVGKSHIIALLNHKIIKDPLLSKHWVTIYFPEEAPGITSLRDFLEKLVTLLVDVLNKEESAKEALKLDDLLDSTRENENDIRVINRIRASLMDWKSRNHQKILVLLENADRVIGNRIAKKLKDEKWLRDLLMNKDLILIIATSPTYFSHIVNKDHPLYELFQIAEINDLSFDESLDMLFKLAKQDGREDLMTEFRSRTKRIQGLHTLTGGNPRFLLMLYILIQNKISNIKELESGFYNLLEELTPYFQARMSQLEAQEEKVLVAFAEGPELLTPAEVGKKIRMKTNMVTAILHRVQSAGFIRRMEDPVKGRRGTLYRLSETVYRYWYQMHSERNREMAEIFISFIVLYYTYKEIIRICMYKQDLLAKSEDTATSIPSKPEELKYLEFAKEIAWKSLVEKPAESYQEYFEEGLSIEEIGRVYQSKIERQPDNLVFLDNYCEYLFASANFEEAILCCEKIFEVAKKQDSVDYQATAYNNWGNALSSLAELKRDEGLFRESFEKYALSVKHKEDKHEAYNNWGNALSSLAKLKGDESLFRESFGRYALAIKYKEDKHEAYNNWGNALSSLAKLKGDEGLFRESFGRYALSVKYKEDFHEAYYNWGNALSSLAKLKGDESLFRESFEKFALAIKYKEDKHETYNNWGNALSSLAKLKGEEGLFRESFEKYALSVKYKEDFHEAYYNWGNALLSFARLKGEEGLFRESFERYALSVKHKEDKHEAYYNWGNALLSLAELKGDESLFRESFERYALAIKYKEDKHEAYNNWGNALSSLAELKGDEGLFRESFERYALAIKYKEDKHEAYYNWGNALSSLAELKGDEGLFRESFGRYALAWGYIKSLNLFDYPFMVNSGLNAVLYAIKADMEPEANHLFNEVLNSLAKVVDLKTAVPYFFNFFVSIGKFGKTAAGGRYLSQLLSTKFKEKLSSLIPLEFLFKYLEDRDVSIIRRQPPEIQKILNEIIEDLGMEKEILPEKKGGA